VVLGEIEMGKWAKDEIERAFCHYEEVVERCGKSVDWDAYVDLFTEDAEYYDDVWEPRKRREAIRRWLKERFATYPADQIRYFPTQWYIIDEERGWVVCEFMNRMVDPGDGSIHQVKNYTRLKYAGNNMWSFQEDQYNPAAFAKMVEGWLQVKGE